MKGIDIQDLENKLKSFPSDVRLLFEPAHILEIIQSVKEETFEKCLKKLEEAEQIVGWMNTLPEKKFSGEV